MPGKPNEIMLVLNTKQPELVTSTNEGVGEPEYFSLLAFTFSHI